MSDLQNFISLHVLRACTKTEDYESQKRRFILNIQLVIKHYAILYSIYIQNDLILLIVSYLLLNDYLDTKRKGKKWIINNNIISLKKSKKCEIKGLVLLSTTFSTGNSSFFLLTNEVSVVPFRCSSSLPTCQC